MRQDKTLVIQIVRSMDGGIGKHIDAIAQALADDDRYESALITSSQIPKNPYNHIWVLPISDSPGFSDLLNAFSLSRIIKSLDNKHIILHGHGAKGGLYARLMKVFFRGRVKVVYTPHGGSLHRIFGITKSMLYDAVEKLLTPLTDHFVFESKYSKNLFCQYISNNIHCSINFNGVNPVQNPKAVPYAPGSPLKLASFGLYRDIKGHDIAIQACALLKKQNVPFHYSIFGEGPYQPNLERLILDLGLSKEISLKGYTESPLEEMKASDIVLHPSRIESFGYVPLEAMSLKVPAITSFNGGLQDYMNDEIGYVAYQNTPEEYFAIIKDLYEGQTHSKLKVENAFHWLAENMTESSMQRKAISIYQELYRPSSRRP